MCYQESQMYLSPEEIALAEENFSMYCEPVKLYNSLKHRASKQPLFLQRSLSYKIQEKRQRRIKMTVRFSGHVSNEVPGKNFWSLYVLLSSPIHNPLEDSSVYWLIHECLLRTSTQQGCNELSAVSFIIPESGKLSVDVDAHNLTLLFVSCADPKIVSCGKASSPQLVECTGQVLWGKVALGSLCSSWQKSPKLRLGERVDIVYPVDLHSSNLEHDVLDDGKRIVLRTPTNTNGLNSVTRLQIIISAQKVGPRDRSPYDSYSYSDIPSSSRLQIIHLKAGNVIFNYKYHNNRLQKTEVTEDFSCPFCLVRCASFKGLRLHLNSCHDRLNFEFWVTEDYQAVNVSLKEEIWRYEGNIPAVDGSDIRKAYFFRSTSCPLKHSPDSRRLGLSQTALSKNTAVTALETSTEIFPIGTIPTKELSSLSIVRSPSSDRIISEGRNHDEQWIEQALEDALAPLNDDEEAAVAHAFEGGNSTDVLFVHADIEITYRSLQCLLPSGWLNDDVINLYLKLLKEREKREPENCLKCHFFDTFFYKKLYNPNTGYDYKEVRRWTKQSNIGYSLMDCDKIFVPIHKENHWCLAIIDMKAKKFQYLDSLRGSDAHVFEVLVKYITDEAKDKTGQVLDASSWETQLVEVLPQQENGWDCGMFMIKYADFHSRGLPLRFFQTDMPYFRRRTAKEILRRKAE